MFQHAQKPNPPPPPPQYEVVFNLQGGGNQADFQTKKVSKDGFAVKPEKEPVKKIGSKEFLFQYWSKDENAKPEEKAAKEFKFKTTKITEKTELFAIWKEKASGGGGATPEQGGGTTSPEQGSGSAVTQCTVTFELHGGKLTGTGEHTQKTVKTDTAVAQPSNPTKANAEFKHWALAENGETPYDFAKKVTGNITLHAVWQEKKPEYTVTFNANGGKNVPEPQKIVHNATVTEPKETERPTKDGFTFKYWSKTQEGTAYNFTEPVTESFTLYALWQQTGSGIGTDSYSVSFDHTGGEGTTPEQTLKKNDRVTEPTTHPVKKGYTFKHWTKESPNGAAYSFSTPVTASFTLYAVWEINTYTVSFDIDGGEGSAPESQHITYGKLIQEPHTKPVKQDFVFKHWSVLKDGTEKYDFKTPVESSFKLYAVWGKLMYTVTFNLDGGIGSIPEQQIEKGGQAALPTYPTKKDHKFKHWSTTQNGTNKYDFKTPVTAPLMLYAVWEKERVSITFHFEDGTGKIEKQDVALGEPATKPSPDPQRDGYTFKHWSAVKNGAEAYTFPPVTTACSVYAVWEAMSADPMHKVTVEYGNGQGSASYMVKPNEQLEKLPNAKKKNALFKHWSTTQNGSAAYDFSKPVTAPLTLYAVYYDIPHGQTRIYDIQGKDHTSPKLNKAVTKVPGIVTGISYKKKNKNTNEMEPVLFFIQDADGDDDPVTSDAIYIYDKENAAKVKVGDAILVDGTVGEYVGKGLEYSRLTVTQLGKSITIDVLSHGNELPPAVELTQEKLVKPVSTGPIGSLEPDLEAIDFYESLECMRVTIRNPKIAATNKGNEYYVVPGDTDPDRISYRGGVMLVDYNATPLIPVYTVGCFTSAEEAGVSKPHPGMGSAYNGSITGVLEYYNGMYSSFYRVLPTEKMPPLSNTTGEIQPEASTIQFAEDKLNVVSYNLKNFSAGNKGDKKRAEQFAKHFINELGKPDVICLIEIQDDNGALKKNKDGTYPQLDGIVSSEETLTLLVNSIKKISGAPVYDKIYINPADGIDGGAPGSNIRCAYLYRTDRKDAAAFKYNRRNSTGSIYYSIC
ncbi:MAG: InlB B-repeat-containing protein [Treponema sp.]